MSNKKFRVSIVRTRPSEAIFDVEAETLEEACIIARERASEFKFVTNPIANFAVSGVYPITQPVKIDHGTI